MRSRRYLFLVLLLLSLACRSPAFFDSKDQGEGEAAATIASTDNITATSAPTGPVVAATDTPAPPPPTPSSTPTAVPSSTPDPNLVAVQLDVFTDMWQLFNDNYLYSDFNGVNWQKEFEIITRQIEAGLTNEQFWKRLEELVDSLGDEHSSYLDPEAVAEEEAITSGNPDYVGVGLFVFTDQSEEDLVGYVFPGGPAEQAGIKAHDWLLAADGIPICCDPDGNRRDIVRGPAGTEVTLTIRTPGFPPREITLTRAPITSGFQVEGRILGGDIAYMLIPTLWDVNIAEQSVAKWDELSDAQPQALIIDLRMNSGGFSTELEGILALFTDGDMGNFVGRGYERSLSITGIDISNSQDIPLVILISEYTESYAEVLSGTLQENDGAILIGRPTAGNVETLYGYDFSDGSRAWIAQESFIPPSGTIWETNGVQPDIYIDQGWGDFASEKEDLSLLAAMDLLMQP